MASGPPRRNDLNEKGDGDVTEADPYERDENSFRTDGRDCCHWCYIRPQAWVWEPYGTRICDHCQHEIAEGRSAEIVDEHSARLTVYGGARRMRDPEQWRVREQARMRRWLEIRTTCEPCTAPDEDQFPVDPDYTPPSWLANLPPDEPWDPETDPP